MTTDAASTSSLASTSTIAALATAPAPAGIAVVRVSGPRTKTVFRAIFRSNADPAADPRRLVFGKIIDYQSGEVIDHALAVYMPGPHSYTGEDVGEFQFHGSPALVQKVLRSLFAFGAVPAEPGEFTKRAFLNGKIDLVQAEAVCDLINATGEQSLRLANEQLAGKLSAAIEKLGEPLRNVLAEIEATIDFPEEGIEPSKLEAIENAATAVKSDISALLQSYAYGHVVKEGFRILLAGKPNAGKSSLLNVLLGKNRAIVSPVSGTTRDLIEEEAIFQGYRFIFCDSAGLNDNVADEVEKRGVELARERLPWADLVLFLVDATDTSSDWQLVLESIRGSAKKIWMVVNKVDLNPAAFSSIFCDSRTCAQNFYISAKTKAGVPPLTQALLDEVAAQRGDAGQGSGVVTNERHRLALHAASDAIERALQGIKQSSPLEIIAVDIRAALSSLEEIVGKTFTDDILGRVFSKFCIGK